MAFEDEYEGLEEEFRRQVESDNGHFGGRKSVYLPNIRPKDRVDFVLIGKHPSCSFASSLDEAREKIASNFQNFAYSFEDFLLHHCTREHLCQGRPSYYITDLAKGAMPIGLDEKEKQERYKRWFPLLLQELQLVAKPGATLIALEGKVNNFLSKKIQRELLNGHAVTALLSFSKTVRDNQRKAFSECYPELYHEFASSIQLSGIENTAQDVMQGTQMWEFIDETVKKRIRGGVGLSESRKKLAFTYKVSFECIRNSCRHENWRDHCPPGSR